MALEHAGDLDAADARQQAANVLRKIARDDLVEIKLKEDVRTLDTIENALGLGGCIEKIAGNVAWTDGLDEEVDAVGRGQIGGATQVSDEHRPALALVAAGGP